MTSKQYNATCVAPANIAFIKYWGRVDSSLNIPYNDSVSMNLSNALTTTSISFCEEYKEDSATLNGEPMTGAELKVLTTHLDLIRQKAGKSFYAHVVTTNSFPTAAGIASS